MRSKKRKVINLQNLKAANSALNRRSKTAAAKTLQNLKVANTALKCDRSKTAAAIEERREKRKENIYNASKVRTRFVEGKLEKAEDEIRELRAIVNKPAPNVPKSKKAYKKHRKAMEQCSRFEKSRRRREMDEFMKEIVATPSDITVPLNSIVGAKLKSQSKVSERQFKTFHKATKAVPSLYAVKKEKEKACKEYGSVKIVKIISQNGKLIDVRTYDLKKALLARIDWTDGEIPDEITVLFTGDGGGGSTKFGFILPDFPLPQSAYNYSILAHYFDSDKRECLDQFLPELLKCIPELREGIQTSKGFKKFKFVFVADFLFGYQYFGLQGASAKFYSPYCLATKASTDCKQLRSIQSIRADFEKLQQKIPTLTSKLAIANAKQECHSTFADPISDEIDLNDYCPPVEHTLAAALNVIIKLKLSAKKRDELFKKAKVSIKYPAQELTGGDGRKFLSYMEKARYKGPGAKLFKTLKKVESFAVARDLEPFEIDEFEKAIKEFGAAVKSGKITHTVKIHALLYHVLPFVKRWGSWGKYSEQAGECIHKLCNEIDSKCHAASELKQAKTSKMFCEEQILSNKVSR